MSIAGTINFVGHVRLDRSTKNNGDWLVRIPEHAIQALATSTIGTGIWGGSLFGTSFQHNKSIAIHVVGGGTSTNGTGFALLLGTGLI